MIKKIISIVKQDKIKVFFLCWLGYALAYVCRNNLSIAMPIMSKSLGFSTVELGLMGSLFFWVYGVGQLINGNIGDKLSTVPFITCGLTVSGITNIFIGFTENLFVMCILWAINGYFLSMLWGPISRILSSVFSEKQIHNIAAGISTSMTGGFILAWGGIGILLSFLDWIWAFIIPGISIIIFALVFFILMQKYVYRINNTKKTKTIKDYTFNYIFKQTRLDFLMISAMAQGMIKDGITLWAPTYMISTHDLNIRSAVGYILLVPFMNLLGVLVGRKINSKFYQREKLTATIFFCGGIISLTLLIFLNSISAIVAMLLLSISSGMMYGCNSVILGVIPMQYKKYNRASSVAGFLDFSAYIAAGLSAITAGFIIQHSSWNFVILIWIIASIIGIIALIAGLNHDKLIAEQV